MARNLPGIPSNHLSTPDAADIRVPYPFTLGMWWQQVGGVSVFDYIVSKVDLAGDHPSFALGMSGGAELRMVVSYGGNSAESASTPTTAGSNNAFDGNWHYICGTYEGTALQCYCDGVLLGLQPLGLPVHYSTGTMYVGGFDGSILMANGNAAELSLWNAQLTIDEISQLVKGFSPALIRPGNLVEHWPLRGVVSPEPGTRKGLPMTITGTVNPVQHQRIYQPT